MMQIIRRRRYAFFRLKKMQSFTFFLSWHLDEKFLWVEGFCFTVRILSSNQVTHQLNLGILWQKTACFVKIFPGRFEKIFVKTTCLLSIGLEIRLRPAGADMASQIGEKSYLGKAINFIEHLKHSGKSIPSFSSRSLIPGRQRLIYARLPPLRGKD